MALLKRTVVLIVVPIFVVMVAFTLAIRRTRAYTPPISERSRTSAFSESPYVAKPVQGTATNRIEARLPDPIKSSGNASGRPKEDRSTRSFEDNHEFKAETIASLQGGDADEELIDRLYAWVQGTWMLYSTDDRLSIDAIRWAAYQHASEDMRVKAVRRLMDMRSHEEFNAGLLCASRDPSHPARLRIIELMGKLPESDFFYKSSSGELYFGSKEEFMTACEARINAVRKHLDQLASQDPDPEIRDAAVSARYELKRNWKK